MSLFSRKKPDLNILVKCSMLFNATEEQIRSFLDEYVKNGNIQIYDIVPIDIFDEKAKKFVGSAMGAQHLMAARCFTSKKNLELFQRDFGKYLHIEEGW